MKYNREFEIAWQGLKNDLHEFRYEIDYQFIQAYGSAIGDIKDLSARVILNFDKKESFFLLHFDIDGTVVVPCDRCGDDFTLALWDEFKLLIKLAGEDAGDVDEDADVVFIPRHETVIDISKWLYEFVLLSIPLQRLHPDKPDGTPGCSPETLKLLNRLSEPGGTVRNDIWKGLKTLKKSKKNKD